MLRPLLMAGGGVGIGLSIKKETKVTNPMLYCNNNVLIISSRTWRALCLQERNTYIIHKKDSPCVFSKNGYKTHKMAAIILLLMSVHLNFSLIQA